MAVFSRTMSIMGATTSMMCQEVGDFLILAVESSECQGRLADGIETEYAD